MAYKTVLYCICSHTKTVRGLQYSGPAITLRVQYGRYMGIKDNGEADKLCREASTLGHEFEWVVTLAGLRAWSKRVRAEAREGEGERDTGMASYGNFSLHLVCHGEKAAAEVAPREDTPGCHCQMEKQSERHVVKSCTKLVSRGEASP